MTKKAVISSLFVCILVQALPGQNDLPSEERRIGIYLETGYFLPAKESFRADYKPGFFLGGSSIPLSLGVGIEVPFKYGTALFLNGRLSKQVLEWNDDNSMLLVPIVAGLQVQLPAETYVGIGVGVSVAIFTSEYLITDETGPDPLGSDRESQSYIGPNLMLQAGVDHQLGKLVKLGVIVSYDINRTGTANKGGLGNVGGFTAAMRFTLLP